MNNYVLVLGVVTILSIVYQIWRGETLTNRRANSSGVSRKTEPGKFWLAIAIQFVILAGFILYFGFR